MTPRPGDLPAAGSADRARQGETAPRNPTPQGQYSAPSPADRPTATPRAGAGPVPPGGQAWSQDTNDTGPVRMQPQPADQAWWEPRPSGAWSTPGWGANRSASTSGQPYTGAPGAGSFGAPGQTGRGGYPGTATMPPVQDQQGAQ